MLLASIVAWRCWGDLGGVSRATTRLWNGAESNCIQINLDPARKKNKSGPCGAGSSGMAVLACRSRVLVEAPSKFPGKSMLTMKSYEVSTPDHARGSRVVADHLTRLSAHATIWKVDVYESSGHNRSSGITFGWCPRRRTRSF